MATNRNEILSKAHKLRELASRGIGGEKDNASIMLKKYMDKHNISESELNGNTYNYGSSDYVNMSDKEFMAEMLTDIFTLGLTALLSSLTKDKDKFNGKQKANEFAEKYTDVLNERINKSRKRA